MGITQCNNTYSNSCVYRKKCLDNKGHTNQGRHYLYEIIIILMIVYVITVTVFIEVFNNLVISKCTLKLNCKLVLIYELSIKYK